MIVISIHFDSNGLLETLNANGHAISTNSGVSIACAAVSTLTRSAARVLVEKDGFEIDLQLPEPGEFYLKVKNYQSSDKEWFEGVSDFIYSGFKDLLKDFPEAIDLKLYRRS